MEKANIGLNAGHVWRRLNGLGLVSVPELSRKLRLSDSDTTLAVGWLAREDKIHIERRNGILYVKLKEISQTTVY